MASVKKFTASAVRNQLRHVEREIENNSNKDICKEMKSENYSFVDREISSFDYYLQRKSEVYCYNRADVKTLAGWVISAPKDLPESEHYAFFNSVNNFLNSRYGAENCVQSVVHVDEETPHLHYLFLPICPDIKHQQFSEKICAADVLNKAELRNFHPALQKHLDNDGIKTNINNGITKANGGNRTVAELKRERKIEHTYSIETGRW